MTSQSSLPTDLSDRDLLAEVDRAVASEHLATARLISLLMEVDSRKLFAGQGYSSMFAYCLQHLHLSEHAAYLRIEAARVARRFPVILDRLADGSVHLTAVGLLAPHVTTDNCLELLNAATHRSKREVEQLLARMRPQPDVPAVVRKLPVPTPRIQVTPSVSEPTTREISSTSVSAASTTLPRPSVIKPLSPERYKVQFTVSRNTHEKLRRAQDLMRHIIPDGNPAEIFDRALTLLLSDLSKKKCGATESPRHGRAPRTDTRHIPAAVRREVWRRDGGRCAFRGDRGRCRETGFLEFHHVVPYAKGGATTTANLELRCRAHNVYEAEQHFGHDVRLPLVRETRASYGPWPN